ncbi:hypothetical protein X975_02183, partial [Stegodyphus mimosarum]
LHWTATRKTTDYFYFFSHLNRTASLAQVSKKTLEITD